MTRSIPSAFGSILSVQRTLREGIEKGYWTVEDLDKKPKNCLIPDERFRNLLRGSAPAPEAVQVTSERDLPPLAQGVTPAEPDGPLNPGWMDF